LNLPENVEGKQVRCPSCRQVFRADKDVLQDSVQAGAPESAPTSVTPKPRDNQEERAIPKRPSLYADYEDDSDYRRDDDHDGDELDGREVKKDVEELVENAKAQTRPAGYVMLGAFFFTAINIAGNGVLTVITQMQLGALPGEILAVGLICSVGFYSIPLIFMMLAGRALLTLGSRGLIITAIVMNFILFILLGGGAALNVWILASGELPVGLGLVLPTVVMNSISTVLNLAAAVMAIRVLRDPDVSEAYAVRVEELWRRRRY
jgi:hypothetical protein